MNPESSSPEPAPRSPLSSPSSVTGSSCSFDSAFVSAVIAAAPVPLLTPTSTTFGTSPSSTNSTLSPQTELDQYVAKGVCLANDVRPVAPLTPALLATFAAARRCRRCARRQTPRPRARCLLALLSDEDGNVLLQLPLARAFTCFSAAPSQVLRALVLGACLPLVLCYMLVRAFCTYVGSMIGAAICDSSVKSALDCFCTNCAASSGCCQGLGSTRGTTLHYRIDDSSHNLPS